MCQFVILQTDAFNLIIGFDIRCHTDLEPYFEGDDDFAQILIKNAFLDSCSWRKIFTITLFTKINTRNMPGTRNNASCDPHRSSENLDISGQILIKTMFFPPRPLLPGIHG